MKKTLFLSLILTACTKTRVVEKPVPVSAPVVETKKRENHASKLVDLVTPLKAQGYVCSAWTGAGTDYENGVDSFLCVGKTNLMWCGAPDNGPPACTTSGLDWTPPAPPAADLTAPVKPKK